MRPHRDVGVDVDPEVYCTKQHGIQQNGNKVIVDSEGLCSVQWREWAIQVRSRLISLGRLYDFPSSGKFIVHLFLYSPPALANVGVTVQEANTGLLSCKTYIRICLKTQTSYMTLHTWEMFAKDMIETYINKRIYKKEHNKRILNAQQTIIHSIHFHWFIVFCPCQCVRCLCVPIIYYEWMNNSALI
jgi:hypothetical protein